MINELYYVAFTGGITFIAFYMIMSTENLGSIFFNAAGLLFVNDMPVVLGMFLKIFVLRNKIGETVWILYTHDRPQIELIAKLVSINGMIVMTCLTWRYWVFDDGYGIL